MSAKTLNTSSSRPISRNSYLMHCAKISVSRRLPWLLLTVFCALAGSVVLNLSLPLTIGLTILAPLLVAGAIALNSWQRHTADYEAQR